MRVVINIFLFFFLSFSFTSIEAQTKQTKLDSFSQKEEKKDEGDQMYG
jgi:hypothetical protein